MTKVKAVASVSFLANRSVSMDVEDVLDIEQGQPMQLDDGTWFCEMLIRTQNGTLAMQLLADDPEHFAIRLPPPPDEGM